MPRYLCKSLLTSVQELRLGGQETRFFRWQDDSGAKKPTCLTKLAGETKNLVSKNAAY